MLDAGKLILELNPPAKVAPIILRALSLEPDATMVVTLCKMAQFYTLTWRYEEADALYRASMIIADAAKGSEDELSQRIRKDYANMQERWTASRQAAPPADGDVYGTMLKALNDREAAEEAAGWPDRDEPAVTSTGGSGNSAGPN